MASNKKKVGKIEDQFTKRNPLPTHSHVEPEAKTKGSAN